MHLTFTGVIQMESNHDVAFHMIGWSFFFYTSIQNKPYCSGVEIYCKQDYKDKGFNIKLRIKEEDFFPVHCNWN